MWLKICEFFKDLKFKKIIVFYLFLIHFFFLIVLGELVPVLGVEKVHSWVLWYTTAVFWILTVLAYSLKNFDDDFFNRHDSVILSALVIATMFSIYKTIIYLNMQNVFLEIALFYSQNYYLVWIFLVFVTFSGNYWFIVHSP